MNENTARMAVAGLAFIGIAVLVGLKTVLSNNTQVRVKTTACDDIADAVAEMFTPTPVVDGNRKVIYDSMMNQVAEARILADRKNSNCFHVRRSIVTATNYANLYLQSGNDRYISKFNDALNSAVTFL